MSTDPFVEYYAAESLKPSTLLRFNGTKDAVMRVAGHLKAPPSPWKVADIGCGAGTQCELWAREGHQVFGLDINAALVELGRSRMLNAGLKVDFNVGSATALPWADNAMDIVLCPELLEHVADWESCLSEATRVLKPGGILYLSTTSRLCPVQQEFALPAYAWYPGPLKRYYERLSVTTRPELVQHAKFPAVHWFSFYQLRKFLAQRGLRSLDRFDVAVLAKRSLLGKTVLQMARATPITRFVAHVLTPNTMVFAQKIAR